jgi:hypothetical protein
MSFGRACVLAWLLAACRDVPERLQHKDPPDAAILLDDGGTPIVDAAIDYGEDGAPIRRPCMLPPTGTAMADGQFGRLDGRLVTIVPLNARTCRGDNDHIHLQILASDQIYDIAINVSADVHSTTFDRPLFAPAWAEGWHPEPTVSVEYTGLDLHADTIPLPGTAALAEAMMAELVNANHISVYATGYGPNGAHLVHRNGGGRDGLIVTHPLAASAHARAFSFSNQEF